jgi:hypothetical protein
MGRGRAKAKQTKVARELKYGGPDTDLSRLQAELAGGSGVTHHEPVVEDTDNEDDLYSKYLDDEDDDEAPRASAR